jgi:hypothetical protein
VRFFATLAPATDPSVTVPKFRGLVVAPAIGKLDRHRVIGCPELTLLMHLAGAVDEEQTIAAHGCSTR